MGVVAIGNSCKRRNDKQTRYRETFFFLLRSSGDGVTKIGYKIFYNLLLVTAERDNFTDKRIYDDTKMYTCTR
jgi:hypothetical protein